MVLQRVHPEDLAFVIQTIDRASREENDIDFEHRLLSPDGAVRYVHVVGRAARDETGKLEYVGALMDVTAAKQVEMALRESEQRIRDYAETASDWLWETGADQGFTRLSEHPDAIGIVPPSRIGAARWDFATDLESEPEKWRLHCKS